LDKPHPDISNPIAGGYVGGEGEWIHPIQQGREAPHIDCYPVDLVGSLSDLRKVVQGLQIHYWPGKIAEKYHLNCLVDFLKYFEAALPHLG
jgi:hypothetical protein